MLTWKCTIPCRRPWWPSLGRRRDCTAARASSWGNFDPQPDRKYTTWRNIKRYIKGLKNLCKPKNISLHTLRAETSCWKFLGSQFTVSWPLMIMPSRSSMEDYESIFGKCLVKPDVSVWANVSPSAMLPDSLPWRIGSARGKAWWSPPRSQLSSSQFGIARTDFLQPKAQVLIAKLLYANR